MASADERRPALRLHQVARPAHRRARHPRADRSAAAGCASSPPPTWARPTNAPSTGSPNSAPRSRSPTRPGPPGCTPRRGCSAAPRADHRVRRLVATCRRPRWSTGWSGTSGSRTSSSRTSSTRSPRRSTDYWDDPAFETYDAGRDAEPAAPTRCSGERRDRTRRPQIAERSTSGRTRYQREILDDLDAERLGARPAPQPGRDGDRHRQDGRRRPRLPTPAQRRRRSTRCSSSPTAEQILRQSLSHVPARPAATAASASAGRRRAADATWRHVFASIQSLHRLDRAELRQRSSTWSSSTSSTTPRRRPTRRLLDAPAAASAARADRDARTGRRRRRPAWFDGRPAVELRLWEALERQLLAPFQYFGVHDDVDLSHAALEARPGLRRRRARPTSTPATTRRVRDHPPGRARQGRRPGADAGARVLREHRARRVHGRPFTAAGIPSAGGDLADRPGGPATGCCGRVPGRRSCKCCSPSTCSTRASTCPRSTPCCSCGPPRAPPSSCSSSAAACASPTDKPCLTVLDFIGGQHAELPLRPAVPGADRGQPPGRQSRAVEQGFPTLPAGCHVELDRVAKEIVLDNLRTALPTSQEGPGRRAAASSVTSASPSSCGETGLELEDIYRRRRSAGGPGCAALAGSGHRPHPARTTGSSGRAIGRMLHLDDVDRLDLLPGSPPVTGAAGHRRDCATCCTSPCGAAACR